MNLRSVKLKGVIAKTLISPALLSFSLSACATGEKESESSEALSSKAGESAPANPDDSGQPALAVSTVASLISVSDVMVREPARFKKALCSDGKIYDLDYDGSRFSLRAEPLSVCTLLSDTKNLKPSGFCGDSECSSAPVNSCVDAEKKELSDKFAKDQVVQQCWNVGTYPPLSFSVLVSRIGQSCQAQALVKNAQGWKVLNSIDGTFEAREGASAQGCFFEAGNAEVADSDWFTRTKRVVPVMTFQKDQGLYVLLKTSWSGSENYQLFRVDGERPLEIESFAESFKDPAPEPLPTPLPPEPKKPDSKAKGRKGKNAEKVPKPEAEKADEPSPAPENPPELPSEETKSEGEKVPEQGVNPLEGEG